MIREVFFYARNHDDAIVLADRLMAKGWVVDRHTLDGNTEHSVVAQIDQEHYPFEFFTAADNEYEEALVREATAGLDAYSDGHGTGF